MSLAVDDNGGGRESRHLCENGKIEMDPRDGARLFKLAGAGMSEKETIGEKERAQLKVVDKSASHFPDSDSYEKKLFLPMS